MDWIFPKIRPLGTIYCFMALCILNIVIEDEDIMGPKQLSMTEGMAKVLV
jgi:hypothetical protein